MGFFDDVARNIGNFFGANNKPKAAPRGGSAPRQTLQAPSNTLRGAATAGVTLPQFDNTAAIAAQQEEERKRREAAELARRQAEEKRRAEEARKAEVARLAKQAVDETNRQLGRENQTIGGEELKAMVRESQRGGDANLDEVKKLRQKIVERKQQAPKQQGPAAPGGVPKAVAGTLEAKRNQILSLQQAVANGQAQEWQVKNATTEFYNEQKRAERIKVATQAGQAAPKDFIQSFNKLTEGQQRKLVDSLTQASRDYAMAGQDPELAALGKAATEKLEIIAAKPEELKKAGYGEVKRKSSFGNQVGDFVTGFGQDVVDTLQKGNQTVQGLRNLATGQSEQADLEEEFKRGKMTEEEFIRRTNEINNAQAVFTGSRNGEDRGADDQFLRSLGTTAEIMSLGVPFGAGARVGGFTAKNLGKGIALDAAGGATIGGTSALAEGEEFKWQDVLASAGIGAGLSLVGSGVGVAANIKRLTGLTPESFAQLPPNVQREIIDSAAKDAGDVVPAAPPTSKAVNEPQQTSGDELRQFEELTPLPREEDITNQYNPVTVADEVAPVVDEAAPIVDEPQITPNAMNGLAAGGKAAAYNILRNSGYKYDRRIENQIAEELAMAKSPLQVKAVLEKYAIKSETPQENFQRLSQQEADLKAQQAQQLAEAPQEVTEVAPTPAPETQAAKADSSPDIAQNDRDFMRVANDRTKNWETDQAHYDNLVSERASVVKDMTPEKQAAWERTKIREQYQPNLDAKGAPNADMTSALDLHEYYVNTGQLDKAKNIEDRITGVSEVDELGKPLKGKKLADAKVINDRVEKIRTKTKEAREGAAPKPEGPTARQKFEYNNSKNISDIDQDVYRGGNKVNASRENADRPKFYAEDAEYAETYGDVTKSKVKGRVFEINRQNSYQGLAEALGETIAARNKNLSKAEATALRNTVMNSRWMDNFLTADDISKVYQEKMPEQIKQAFDDLGITHIRNRGDQFSGNVGKVGHQNEIIAIPKPKSPEAPAPKTETVAKATTPNTTPTPVTKTVKGSSAPVKGTSDTPPAVNPGLKMTEAANIRPVGKGKGADNTQAIQRDLIADADKLPSKLGNTFRTVENLARNLERYSKKLGKHYENFRREASDNIAQTVIRTDENMETVAKSFKGQNKDQRKMTKYLIENMSNKPLMNKYKKTNPTEYQAATELSTWIKAQLPEMNAVLKEYGLKEIGKVEDYFPRMAEFNKTKNSLSDILDTSIDSTISRGEANVKKSFMKARTAETATGKELDPMDAMLVYARQSAQVIHLTRSVERGKKITAAIEAVEDVPEAVRKEVADLFRQVYNQQSGKDMHPETWMQRRAAGLRNITSRSQIAASVSSVYAQIANPVAVTVRMLGEGNSVDIFRLAGNMAKTIGKGVKELETIDGMTSSYLVTARGTKNIRRNDAKGIGSKVVGWGYRGSNLGDLQSKHAAVRTLYDGYRSKGMSKQDALRKAERDAKDAIGDRTMGERSTFTASNKAFNVVASQYQIEQIANVTSFLDGVLFNPRIGHGKRTVGVLAALGTAYGANQLVGFASQGQVKPLPDMVGAGLEAWADVQEANEERQKNGEPAMKPEEMAGLWLTHTGATYANNLPFGRTVMSGVNLAVTKVGENKAINNPTLADDLGLNAKDTNPFQTLPTFGTIARFGETIDKANKGDKPWLPNKESASVGAAGELAAMTIPYGGQTKKSIEGGMAMANGEVRYADEVQDDGTVKKGDKQFDIDNKLDKPSSFHNLFSMITSGKFANKGGQEYIKSGFKSSIQRELKAGEVGPDKVASLNDEQYEEYAKQSKKKFATTLSDKEKKLNTLMGNDTLLNRNLGNGKVTEDEIADLKVKKNKYMYENGLIDQIETGFKKEELDALTPTLRAWVYDKAIQGRKTYKEKATTEASTAVINEALKNEEAWPGVDLKNIKATNELADKYLSYKMDSAKKVGDQAEQFDLRKKFWGQVVRQKYDKDIPGAYVGPQGTSTNARDTYGQNLKNIEAMLTEDGLKIGSTLYQLNDADIDAMLSLDDELVKAGLISEPKFKDKWRNKFGFRLAPDGDVDTENSYSRSTKSGSGGGRGRGGGGSGGSAKTGPQSDANPTAYLNKMGTGSKGFNIKQAGGADSAPNINFAQFRNKGSKSGKSSIKIKL